MVAVETGRLGVCAVVLKLCFLAKTEVTTGVPVAPGVLINGGVAVWGGAGGGGVAEQTPLLLADLAGRAAASWAEATSMRSGATPAGPGVGPS